MRFYVVILQGGIVNRFTLSKYSEKYSRIFYKTMSFQANVPRRAVQHRDNWTLGTFCLFMQLSETPSQADEFSRIDAPSRYRNSARIVFSPWPEKKKKHSPLFGKHRASHVIEIAMESSPPVLSITQVCYCAQYNELGIPTRSLAVADLIPSAALRWSKQTAQRILRRKQPPERSR